MGPGRSISSANGYRYGFNGKENDNEVKGEGVQLDYGMRIYDARWGRFLSVDPLAHKASNYSPYAFCFNNPILLVDPDGAFPYPIHIRYFIPEKQIAAGFSGDNRGYSTALSTSARIHQSLVVDPTAASYNGLNTWSSPTNHIILPSKTAKPSGTISDFTSSKDGSGNSSIFFTTKYAASNPLVPLSPDIDVSTTFSLTENLKAGKLDIVASQVGDRYPAAETFIGDTKGNQLFIGVSPFDGNPASALPGDNKREMMSSAFTVLIDKNGVFTGVKQGKSTYTTTEWNKMMQSQPLDKNAKSTTTFEGGSMGGGGACGEW